MAKLGWGEKFKVRELILEALYALGENGGTREEIASLIEKDFPKDVNIQMSVGRILGSFLHEGTVEVHGSLWRIADTTPKFNNGTAMEAAAHEGERSPLSAYQQNRAANTVTLYHSPIEIEDVIRIRVRVENGSWFNVPIFGDVRICLGPGIPKWNAEQEVNRGIVEISVQRKNGDVMNYPCNPQDHITFAGSE